MNSSQPVICCFPIHLNENEVLDLIYDPIRKLGIQLFPFEWHKIPPQKCDIFDVHWPDAVVMGRSRIKAFCKLIIFLATVFILKSRGTKIFYHVHNIGSHDSNFPRFERFLWRQFLPRVDVFIHMNTSSPIELKNTWPVTKQAQHEIIFLPYYDNTSTGNTYDAEEIRSQYGLAKNSQVLLCFGLLRPYKGIEDLIDAFNALSHLSSGVQFELVIAGKPFDRNYGDQLVRLCGGNKNIKIFSRFLADAELSRLLYVCDTVVMAHRKVNNSGVALKALSSGRRLIAPAKGAMMDLALSVGPDWMTLFEKLSEETLQGHLMRPVSGAILEPDLSLFEPNFLAEQLADLYRGAMKNSAR